MRRRLLLVLVTTLLALAGADLWMRSRQRGGTFEGLAIPPFGVVEGQRREWVERRLEQARRAGDSGRVFLEYSQRYGWTNNPGWRHTQ
jgi:hypothetical protein